ncbi:TPA: sugar ABC transporter ATP-binding protein [Klebsiella pneumoniae]|uniref:sugar ABC transporter ATP-binding protein n=1 Tax=Enterobacteriaceae TaxID=543 RepID=UPI000659A2D5|nr:MULTISPECIES: sugar ABC transporter ATP-binding protein [Klebsiella]EKT9721080.1 sugar ABC transporter ATP-binding protein [Klebsiella variicola]HCA9671146.1 sugar ABC transporter ATP-binding protein [Klebsiella variicola subsp. variicola]EKU9431041.1 sugar ABC transporter ATP-binding protein [Klebsiella variicola]ELA0872270.1 sugar ABC transporter ATP-binding protein [Klebsiella variicola]KLY24135.1 hypothetical protein SK92_05566 [Klebsiella oxytoca]
MSEKFQLEMTNIKKSFGAVKAIESGSLFVRRGEVHALMGANGAGKSTMMNIIGGIFPHDSGDIIVKGREVIFRNPKDAIAHGIAFVHQELTMFPTLNVAENIFIDDYPKKGKFINKAKIHEESSRLLKRVGCHIDTHELVEQFSTGTRQLIEIARALKMEPDIVIFDEPTSSLSAAERKHLFRVIKTLKQAGTAIIYISHFMDEVFEISDTVTVMRNGVTVSSMPVGQTTITHTLGLMLGSVGESERVRPPCHFSGTPVVQVEGLNRSGVLRNINMSLRPGEIVGLWGLLGSGRTELVRSLMGLDPIDGGKLLFSQNGSLQRIKPSQLRKFTGLVTEDRRGEGLILPFSIEDNMTLPFGKQFSGKFSLFDRRKISETADKFIERLKIKCHSASQPVEKLSGGNQQKVVFARWLIETLPFFILDEPTRGLDVGAKGEIMKLIVELAECGVAILIISSEPEEIMRVSDRYYVIQRGEITGELPGDSSRDRLMESLSVQQVAEEV